LQLPLSALNLTVRASHCLSDIPTIADLMACAEAELMRRRNFGRVTLADVRRKLVAYLGERMASPADARVRAALDHPPPAIARVWETPAQPRPLAAVVSELLDLLAWRATSGRSLAGARRPTGSVRRPPSTRRGRPWRRLSSSSSRS
jgi:hypothetical protein